MQVKLCKEKDVQYSRNMLKYAVLQKEYGKISIEIDILTPCLKRVEDGVLIDTY